MKAIGEQVFPAQRGTVNIDHFYPLTFSNLIDHRKLFQEGLLGLLILLFAGDIGRSADKNVRLRIECSDPPDKIFVVLNKLIFEFPVLGHGVI